MFCSFPVLETKSMGEPSSKSNSPCRETNTCHPNVALPQILVVDSQVWARKIDASPKMTSSLMRKVLITACKSSPTQRNLMYASQRILKSCSLQRYAKEARLRMPLFEIVPLFKRPCQKASFPLSKLGKVSSTLKMYGAVSSQGKAALRSFGISTTPWSPRLLGLRL